jgi:hypothetical protein
MVANSGHSPSHHNNFFATNIYFCFEYYPSKKGQLPDGLPIFKRARNI